MVQDVMRPFGAPKGTAYAILLSIAPHHADRIFSFAKCWEFRRVCPRAEYGTTAFIYETRPRMGVTGLVTVGTVRHGPPAALSILEEDLWSRDAVLSYLKGGSRPGAIQILHPRHFDTPMPVTHFSLTRPPQSYAWVADIGRVS